ncbi:MAG: NAD(+)/NADH kinase [Eubacteriales bacterium]|nr:NAD(+)/NADH kinase [Eubacteriales bacterium]
MIAICPNPYRDIKLEITEKIEKMLSEEGFETCICPVFADSDDAVLPAGKDCISIEEAAPECSLAVVIGGDGTILSVARSIHNYEIPIIGINLGTKGFMAGIEKDQLEIVAEAAKGNVRYGRRMKLDTRVIRNGECVCADCALNDAVIHGYGDCINITASCCGDVITDFSGDGIVVATPTGSTGYSMSAGGPIVEPDAENIIISPICPHAIWARSFVLAPDKKIEVTIRRLHDRRAYLSVDGNSVCDLENGDILQIGRSEHYTVMAAPENKSFFEITYSKLK